MTNCLQASIYSEDLSPYISGKTGYLLKMYPVFLLFVTLGYFQMIKGSDKKNPEDYGMYLTSQYHTFHHLR